MLSPVRTGTLVRREAGRVTIMLESGRKLKNIKTLCNARLGTTVFVYMNASGKVLKVTTADAPGDIFVGYIPSDDEIAEIEAWLSPTSLNDGQEGFSGGQEGEELEGWMD